ncbi:MAG: hypothetical protein [Circular genetic element sp.]|jgi:hypothetical protein|nr:MAG: hypothetical protein [Circular genetic element sp.]
MAKTNFAPWSAETAQGIKTDPVDSNIKVRQEVVPAITVGTVNALTGEWTGVIESDTAFLIDPSHDGIPNGASVLSPQQSDHEYIDMTGFNDLFIALNVSNAGAFKIVGMMGPSTYSFANLTPVNAGSVLRGAINDVDTSAPFFPLLLDTTETLVADVWNIFYIKDRLASQKLLQFEITNNSGDASNIQFASLRVV